MHSSKTGQTTLGKNFTSRISQWAGWLKPGRPNQSRVTVFLMDADFSNDISYRTRINIAAPSQARQSAQNQANQQMNGTDPAAN